jgi:hypothetical protein
MESLSDGFKALKRRGFGHTTESTIFISSKPATAFCSQANLFISFQLFLTDLPPRNACTPIFHSVKINLKTKKKDAILGQSLKISRKTRQTQKA